MNEEKKPLESAGKLRQNDRKNPRLARTPLLLLAIAALGFALFFAIRENPAPEVEQPDTQVVLIARDKTLLGTITVQMAGSDSYTLINQVDYDLSDTNDELGKEYAVQGNPDFAVSTSQVLPMERYASDLTAEDVAARSPKDLNEFGLLKPDLTIVIGYRDGVRETLRFGGAVPTGIGFYLQRVGDPAVYVIAESVYEAFARKLPELEQTQQERDDLKAAQEADKAAPDATATDEALTDVPDGGSE